MCTHHQLAFGSQPFRPFQNLAIVTGGVLGGVGSPMGAVLGALWLQGTRWFLPGEGQLLASGAGVLAVLLIMPSGLGGLVLRLRDAWLSRLATNRNLDAPGFTPPGSGLAPEDQDQAELEVPVAAATRHPPNHIGSAQGGQRERKET